MNSDRLVSVAAAYFPTATLSATYIYNAVLAAERDLERAIRTFTVPTIMVPEGTNVSVTEAYDAANPPVPYQWEPAYDWDPEFFRGNHWGYIQLRQRPIISVQSMQFIYPSTGVDMFTIPTAWIRMDQKYGSIRLVPTGTATTLPLNAWLLQIFSGGEIIPHMLQISYTAGLSNEAVNGQDILDLIKKMATLRILEDQYLPQSGSISADGLSQSMSVDVQKYRDIIQQRIERLRQSLQGQRLDFL